jgi:hypothetical protein
LCGGSGISLKKERQNAHNRPIKDSANHHVTMPATSDLFPRNRTFGYPFLTGSSMARTAIGDIPPFIKKDRDSGKSRSVSNLWTMLICR